MTSSFRVAPAEPADAPHLSLIAHAAKAHWGYPSEWLDRWKAELDFTEAFIIQHPVFKLLTADEEVIGCCAFMEEGPTLWVDRLWVLPEYIGKGLGRKLFREALGRIVRPTHLQLKVVSDPNAVGFYEKEGFELEGYEGSWPEGRRLPVLSCRNFFL
ncbi:MAG: GNAT family N-acetyltransferase [Bacteroidota bacterium]